MLRKFPLLSYLLIAVSLGVRSARAEEPVRLILDTDIGNDVDDALALAMIHAFETRGDVHLLAVTITKDNRYAAPFVNLVNTFYGRPDIPIGIVHDGKTKEDSPMLRIPVDERNPDGSPRYPHQHRKETQVQDAVELLTSVLSAQPDDSVTIAQIGFSTNLMRLLDSRGGRDLVKRKVKLLCVMAGNFVKSQPEYNVYTDPESAKALFESWPTPMIFSGFEIGLQITFPFEAIQKDFSYVPRHPIAEAYRLYVKKPEDHPNWDSTAVLEAIQPDRGYFDLSAPGQVKLGPNNTTTFTPDPQGNRRYLIMKPDQVSRIRQLISDLVSEPPQTGPATVPARPVAF
ncbi:MAG TPA: nucleoside hydrolase [Bryobacteraceae bacterium]|jgi:inosine-uridine nucleoside N-ribohydrolase